MNDFSSLEKNIKDSSSYIQKQIPGVEKEALRLIKSNCTDIKTIEHYLDTLHSFHISGFRVKAHLPLIGYFSKFDKEAAMWYKEAFEKTAE